MSQIKFFFLQLLLIPFLTEAQNRLITTDNKTLITSEGNILKNPPVPPCGTLTVTDIDGNVYNTVAIGSQCWLGRNLAVTKFNDGTPLARFSGGGHDGTYIAWTSYAGYMTFFDKNIYGHWYNWRAVDNNPATRLANNGSKNICPFGWHVPNDTEWQTLNTFLGAGASAGGALKEAGYTHWRSPNGDATNSSGFTAVAGGIWSSGYYNYHGYSGGYEAAYFWSTTSSNNGADNTLSWWNLQYLNGWLSQLTDARIFMGMSVRCLKN
jgi:uncharacterized protein (TIGR02145 family)